MPSAAVILGIVGLVLLFSSGRSTQKRRKRNNPRSLGVVSRQGNPLGSAAYRGFHGTSPKKTRTIQYNPPKGPVELWGRIRRIEYQPEGSSTLKNTIFYHKSGDTGEGMVKSNLLVVRDAKGKMHIISENPNAKYPTITERGIEG